MQDTVPVTIVADTAADSLRASRTLQARGCRRLTSLVGGDALRYRLPREDAPGVLVLDLFLADSPAALLGELRLHLRDATVVVVTDRDDVARAAGAYSTVAPGDVDGLGRAVVEACAAHEAKTPVPVAA